MQATMPLSRLNITLYSVERRAINSVEKCAYSRALNRLSNSVLICHGIARIASLFPFSSRGGNSPRTVTRRFASKTRCICIGRVFRARSVRLIDLEPCLKFTWVMSMKLERILIARLECSSFIFARSTWQKLRMQFDCANIAKYRIVEIIIVFIIGRKRGIELM